jgi:hypothetical protein
MWMTELARNTTIAESTMGIQSDIKGTMIHLLKSRELFLTSRRVPGESVNAAE